MAIERKHAPLLREDGGGDRRVTPIELYFDLVFVFALTQYSRLLANHLTPYSALQTGLLLTIGWGWVCTAWATNWLKPNWRPQAFSTHWPIIGTTPPDFPLDSV